MPEVVIFSPSEPGERAMEGCFEEGEARRLKREESIMCTWRGEELGVVAQLWKLGRYGRPSQPSLGTKFMFQMRTVKNR